MAKSNGNAKCQCPALPNDMPKWYSTLTQLWHCHRAPPNGSGQMTPPNDTAKWHHKNSIGILHQYHTTTNVIKNHTVAALTTAPQQLIHKNKTAPTLTSRNHSDGLHWEKHQQPTPAILHWKSIPPNCANNLHMTKCTDNKHWHTTTTNGATKLHQQPPHSLTNALNKHTEKWHWQPMLTMPNQTNKLHR